MKKLTYDQIQNEQIVDLRPQKEFQSGHLPGALNLIPKNLVKYGKQLLNPDQSVILVVAEANSSEMDALQEEARAAGIESIVGYLVAEELPANALDTTPLISAADFMSLEGEGYRLLDVRHPDEITRPAPKKNLVNVPMEDLPEKQQQLQDKQIYTLCGSGNRATAAASYLEKQGYKPIVIEGGMGAIEALRQKDDEK